MRYILLYTDSCGQQCESAIGSVEELRELFRNCQAVKGEIYNARSVELFHAGVRRYAPVVIEQLYGVL